MLRFLTIVSLLLPTLAVADVGPTQPLGKWPLALDHGFEPTVERKDFDGDGAVDTKVSIYDGGSGYKSFTNCYRDGKSKHKACAEWQSTTYSGFSGHRVAAFPKRLKQNRAVHKLPTSVCQQKLSSRIPDQGALSLLRKRPKRRWFTGKPVFQASVCISRSRARDFPKAYAWAASGEISKNHQVVYNPSTLLGGGQRSRKPLRRVLTTAEFHIYQFGHALAIYWPRRDRHAWFFHAESLPAYDFKFDRRTSIKSVSQTGNSLKVELADRLGPAQNFSLTGLRP